MTGWIGVDLDGTLAEYHPRNGGTIGAPVGPMIQRVLAWLDAGHEVHIVTARGGPRLPGRTVDPQTERQKIEAWCLTHLGRVLPVTASKDFDMLEPAVLRGGGQPRPRPVSIRPRGEHHLVGRVS